jgi:hypothetical protein
MRSMAANFKCQGVSRVRGYAEPDELDDVNVRLITDGVVVMLDRSMPNGELPALTPIGWATLADCASTLVMRANEAWAAMGAEA